MGMVAGSQALTNMSVVKSELYTLRWSYVCNSLTVFMHSLFVLEAILGYTIHRAGYTLRLNLELNLPPVYIIWHTGPHLFGLSVVLLETLSVDGQVQLLHLPSPFPHHHKLCMGEIWYRILEDIIRCH